MDCVGELFDADCLLEAEGARVACVLAMRLRAPAASPDTTAVRGGCGCGECLFGLACMGHAVRRAGRGAGSAQRVPGARVCAVICCAPSSPHSYGAACVVSACSTDCVFVCWSRMAPGGPLVVHAAVAPWFAIWCEVRWLSCWGPVCALEQTRLLLR